jgi:hypothetical protein
MDAKILSLAEAGTPGPTVTNADLDAIASMPAGGVASPLRRRFTLESMWERKLDEVVVLAGACQGVSAAGDDPVPDGATLPSLRLFRRAVSAYEELTAIADAIDRIDGGSYGACVLCGQPMPDEQLVSDPLARYCRRCSVPAPRDGSVAQVVAIASRSCRS